MAGSLADDRPPRAPADIPNVAFRMLLGAFRTCAPPMPVGVQPALGAEHPPRGQQLTCSQYLVSNPSGQGSSPCRQRQQHLGSDSWRWV